MGKLHFLPPRRIVNGMEAEFYKNEAGGIEVIIWRDESHDDGFMVPCSDWEMVHQLLDDINRVMTERRA